MGTNAEPKINFEEKAGINGSYSPGTNTVTIPPSKITADDGYVRLKTVMHELRHAYQYETVNDPNAHSVGSATREAWTNNFPGTGTYVGGNDAPYYQQPIEWDAFNFATQYDRVERFIEGNNNYQGSWDQAWRDSD
jgi:hypothetical protein